MVSNISFDIFGNVQMLIKLRMFDPLCIAEIFQKYKKFPNRVLHMFANLMISFVENVGQDVYRGLGFSEFFYIVNFRKL